MNLDEQHRLARLLSLRILRAQEINEAFIEKVRAIAAVHNRDWWPLTAPVKKLNRAFEKAATEDWPRQNALAEADGKPWGYYSVETAANNVNDLVRGSIIVQDAAEMPEALEEIKKVFEVTRFKDRWNNPLPSGYADYLLNVAVEIGEAEFQVHIPEMLVAKEGWFDAMPEAFKPVDEKAIPGHHYYVEQRSLDVTQPNYKEQRQTLDEIMREIYFSAILAHYERTGSLPDRLRKAITKFSQSQGKRFSLLGFAEGSATSLPESATKKISLPEITTGKSASPSVPKVAPAGTAMGTESMPEHRADRELTQDNLRLAMGAPSTPPVEFSYSLGIPRAGFKGRTKRDCFRDEMPDLPTIPPR